MIETDGVSCSILLLRKDKVGKLVKNPKVSKSELYIDQLNDYTDLVNKKIVGIDPGLNDLIYCVDGSNKEASKYRYSQDRRRKETKKRKYAKIVLEFKQAKIEGKTVIEHETSLSVFNRKTLELKAFQEYCQHKNELNRTLFRFYDRMLFRKLKLNSYWNTKKS